MFLIILLVVLGGGLVAVYMNREKDEAKAKVATVGLTIAILVVAMLNLLNVGDDGAQVDTSVDYVTASVAADRIAQAAQGSRVVLVADPRDYNPMAKVRLEAFRERLPAHNKEILGVQSPWPEDPADYEFPEEGLSTWGISKALANFGDVEVVISLAGVPVHGLDDISSQLESVEFFAMDQNFHANSRELVTEGPLKGMVVPPFESNWSDLSGADEELFNRRYVFVTRENLSEVADRLADPYESMDW